MKLSLALLALFSVNSYADDSITCTGHGESVTVTQTRFDQSLVHNGRKYTECKREQSGAGLVAFECQKGGLEDSVQLFVHLKNGRAVSAGLAYILGETSYGGETDGSTIELSCKD